MSGKVNIDTKTLYKKYLELKTIKAVGIFYNIHPEIIRKKFIKENLAYVKKDFYKCNEDVFLQDTEESFYWAGFMAADGNVSKNNDICIYLKSSDKNHLEKFKNFLQSNTIISKIIKKDREIEINGKIYKIIGGEYSRIRIRNNKLAEGLKRFNIIPNKTKIYDIPEWVINHQYFNHFLRGYFDGDGWFVNRQKNNLNWGICGNLNVVNKIKDKLQIECNIKGKCQFVKQVNIYKISYNRRCDIINICNYIYNNANSYLDRKYKQAFNNNYILLNNSSSICFFSFLFSIS